MDDGRDARFLAETGKVRENAPRRGMTLRQAAHAYLVAGRGEKPKEETGREAGRKTGCRTARRAYGETDGDGRVRCGQHDRKHDRRAVP